MSRGRKKSRMNARKGSNASLSGRDITVKIEGKYLFSITRNMGATAIYRLPLNPGFIPGSAALAATFQEFRYTGIKIKLHANNNFQQVISYFKVNPSVTPPGDFLTTYAGLASRYMSQSDTEPQTLVLTRSELLDNIRPWYQCTSATSTGNSETDDYSQGAIFIANTGALAATAVMFEIAYMVEYRGPSVSPIQEINHGMWKLCKGGDVPTQVIGPSSTKETQVSSKEPGENGAVCHAQLSPVSPGTMQISAVQPIVSCGCPGHGV